MLGKLLKIFVVLVMLAGLGGSGYLWYLNNNLEQEITGLNKDIEKGKQRERALKKKYTQEKAKLGTCMRVKMAEQGKRQQLQVKIESLEKEKQGLADEMARIETKFEARLEKHKTRIEKLKASREEVLTAMKALREKYKSAVLDARKKDEKVAILNDEKQELKSTLKMTESSLFRSNKHNTKLCVIAEELTQRYREKAGNGDPFTKLKMVEIEHLIQSYIKRIDKEKIVTQ